MIGKDRQDRCSLPLLELLTEPTNENVQKSGKSRLKRGLEFVLGKNDIYGL